MILLRVLPAGRKPTRQEIEQGRAQCLRLGATREQVDTEIEQRRRSFMTGGKHEVREADEVDSSSESEYPEGYGSF